MVVQGLTSAKTQESPQTPLNTASSQPNGFLGKIRPFLSRKLIGLCSAAYQTMRAASPQKFKYHIMKHAVPHQLNQKILQTAAKLAQELRQNIIDSASSLEDDRLLTFENGEVYLDQQTIEHKTEEALAILKEKYPIKKSAESILRQVIAYHLDSNSMFFNTLETIKNNINSQNSSKQKGNFDFKEKIYLFSSLRQKYIDQPHIQNDYKEEMSQFILKELFSSEISHNPSHPYSIQSKLEHEILLQAKALIIKNSDAPEAILSLIEKESAQCIHSLFSPEEKEDIENFFSISLSKMAGNILLHYYAPSLLKEKISEEVKLQIENNPDLKNVFLSLDAHALKEKISEVSQKISTHYPRASHFFIQRAVQFQMNKEQTLIHFIKNFLSSSQSIFDLYCKNGTFSENTKKFDEQIDRLLSEHPYLKNISPELVEHLKSSAFNISEMGVYLDKKIFGLDNSLIICAKSHDAYALKNSLSENDINHLKVDFPETEISTGKHVIGQGGFGKVRFAQNIETGHYVAVKKITRLDAAYDELEGYQIAGKGKNFVTMHNYSNVTNHKNPESKEKFYLFIEFLEGSDGVQHYKKTKSNQHINAQRNPEDAKKLKNISQNYLSCVVDLHKKGVFHRDIKPENFLHAKDESIKIMDYGLCTTITNRIDGGTPHYACPEFFRVLGQSHLYNAQKHDSFSLGVSLLKQCFAFKMKMRAELDQITVMNSTKHYFLGFKNTENLKGNHIDEVIMKLMDQNPMKRITPEEALNLPYFNEENPPLLLVKQNKTFMPLYQPTKPNFRNARAVL